MKMDMSANTFLKTQTHTLTKTYILMKICQFSAVRIMRFLTHTSKTLLVYIRFKTDYSTCKLFLMGISFDNLAIYSTSFNRLHAVRILVISLYTCTCSRCRQ